MTRDKLIGMGRKFRARRKVACTPTLKFILGAIDTQAGDAEKVTLFYFCGFLGLNIILQETDTSSTSDSPPYIHTPPAAPVKRKPELPCSDSPAKKAKKAAEKNMEEEEAGCHFSKISLGTVCRGQKKSVTKYGQNCS